MTTPGDKTVEAEVLATMKAYREATESGDLNALLACYSEDWEDNHGRRKGALRESHKGKSEKGGHNEPEVDVSEAVLVVDGDNATFSPVTLWSPSGSITYTHKLKKEADGDWRLIHTEGIDWGKIPMDLAERRRKAENDASAMIACNLREQILSDPSHPGYHFVAPEGLASPFDPNGAIYWKGRYHLFYIFQDKRSGKKSDHWGHVSSTDLLHWRHHPTSLLEGMYSGNSFELSIEMESSEASEYGVKVCVSPDGQEETVISYDVAQGRLQVDTRKSGPAGTPRDVEAGPFELKQGERLKLRVFVDKSVVEVFANGRQAVMRRIYPSQADSVGISMFSTGGTTQVHTFESWHISPSNPY
jgi:ketosteroid isomerase-like protein